MPEPEETGVAALLDQRPPRRADGIAELVHLPADDLVHLVEKDHAPRHSGVPWRLASEDRRRIAGVPRSCRRAAAHAASGGAFRAAVRRPPPRRAAREAARLVARGLLGPRMPESTRSLIRTLRQQLS